MSAGRFQFKKLAKYPHMEAEDIITWEKFIDAYPNAYTSIDYDFALSKVEEATKTASELNIAGAERTFKYRADVIGYGNKEVHIIELKKKATPGILGYLKAEKILYDRDENTGPPAKMVVIAREATPDMDTFIEAAGISLILV